MACEHDWEEIGRTTKERRERVVNLGAVLGGPRKHIELTYEIRYRCRGCGREATKELITHSEEPVAVTP